MANDISGKRPVPLPVDGNSRPVAGLCFPIVDGMGRITGWAPAATVDQGDGTLALKVDTELIVEDATIVLGNVKVGSTDQTAANVRYLKVENDGTVHVLITNPAIDTNVDRWGGTDQTGADLTPLFQNLDVALSTLATEATLSAIQVLASSIDGNLDVALSTRASEATLAGIKAKTDLLTFATGRLVVDGSQVTQPISAASLPLPTGAATETTLSSVLTELLQKTEPADQQHVIIDTIPEVEIKNDAGSPIPVTGTIISTPSGVQDVDVVGNTIGLATEATVAAIEADTDNLDVLLSTRLADATFTSRINTLGQKLMAASTPVVLASDQTVIPVSDNGASLTVDGTVAATQSGTWNINNITGTISLPTGAATEATLADVKTATETLAGTVISGRVQVDADLSGADIEIGAVELKDGTTDTRATIESDGVDNALVVKQNSQPLPAGAATEATLATRASETTADAIKTAVESVDTTLDVALSTRLAEATFTGRINTLGQKVMSASTPVVIASDQTVIPVSDNGGALTVDAVNLDIRDLTSASDSVAAVQSGTWNINDISGTISLPTGAATSANQATEITALQLIDDIVHSMNAAFSKAAAIGGQLDDTTTTAATEDNVAPLRITAQRAAHVNLRNVAGTEIGTASNPVRTDPTGTTTQPVSLATQASYIISNGGEAPGNGKSMLSLLNGAGSDVIVRIRKIFIRNVTTSAITGVLANLEVFRITGHSSGNVLTPVEMDTNQALDSDVTARSAASISGEGALLDSFNFSSDELASGGTGLEDSQQSLGQHFPVYIADIDQMAPITLRASQGIHVKCQTNTTVGAFDVIFYFTVSST